MDRPASREQYFYIQPGWPYGSKAWLASHNILPTDKYPAIKDLVIAKQPNKEAAYKKK